MIFFFFFCHKSWHRATKRFSVLEKIEDRVFKNRSYSLGIKSVYLPLYKKARKRRRNQNFSQHNILTKEYLHEKPINTLNLKLKLPTEGKK